MARRVNTKFVIFLGLAVVLAGAGAAALFFIVKKESSADLIRGYEQQVAAAQEAEARGEIDPAIEARRRADTYLQQAIQKEANLDLSAKRIENLLAMPSRNQTEAQGWIGAAQNAGEQVLATYTNDPGASELIFDVLRNQAEVFNESGAWSRVAREARARLETSPDDNRAALALAIASAQGLNPQLSAVEREEARRAIADALDANPDHPDARLAQARWAAVEVERLTDESSIDLVRDRVEEQRANATGMLGGLDPGNLTAWQEVSRIRLLMLDAIDRRDEGARALENLARQPERFDNRARLAGEVANLLLRMSKPIDVGEEAIIPGGEQLAETLMRARIDAEPDNPGHRVALGVILQQRRDFARAGEQFAAALPLEKARPPVGKLLEVNELLNARYRLAENTLLSAQTSGDREGMLERAEEMVSELRIAAPDSRQVRLLEGEIAYLRQDFSRAAQLLTSIDLRGAAPRVLLMAAESMDRSGRRTEATRRYATLVSAFAGVDPTNPARQLVIGKAAQAALIERNYEMVLRVVEPMVALDPPPAGTLELRSAALIGLERYAEAEALLNTGRLSSLSASFQRAEIFRKTGNKVAAQRLLAGLFEDNRTNRALLTRLLNLTDDAEERQAFIAKAEEAGLEPAIAEALRTRSSGDELSLDQRAKLAAQNAPDPVTAQVVEAQVLWIGGDIDRGRELFNRARDREPQHKSVLIAGVDFAILDENFDEAEQYARAAGERNLDGADGQILLGKVQAARGDLDQAIVTLRNALEVNPVSTDGRKQLATLLMRQNRYNEAVDEYRELLRSNARDARALVGLAQALARLNRQEEALEELRRIISRFDDDRQLRELYLVFERDYGSPQRFISERQRIAQQYPDDTGNIRTLAITLAREARYPEALDAIALLPPPSERSLRDAVAHTFILSAQGDAEEAESLLMTHLSTREESDDLSAMLLAARVLADLEQIDLALKVLERAEPYEDRRVFAVARERANVLMSANRLAEAEPILRRLSTSFPQETAIRDTLGRALLGLNRVDESQDVLAGGELTVPSAIIQIGQLVGAGQVDQALAVAERAVAQFPSNATLRARRASLYAAKGQLEQAQQDVARALELDSRSVDARMVRAQLLAVDERLGEAVGEFRLLVDENPTRVDIRRLLANALMREGDRVGAWRELEAAGENDPNNPIWPLQAGKLAEQVGDSRNALRLFRKSVDIRAVPDTVGVVAKLLLEQDRFREADAFLSEHPSVVNQAPMIQSLKAWALFGLGQTDQGRNLMVDAMQRIAPFARQRRAVLLSAAGMLGATEAANLTLEAVDAELAPQVLLEAAVLTDDPQEALTLVERGLAMPSVDPAVVRLLKGSRGVHLDAVGRDDEAVAVYRELVAQDPSDLSAVNNLAYLLVDLERADEALELAEQAMQLNPNLPEVLDTLGAARLANGDLNGAIDALEQAQPIWRTRPTGGSAASLIRLGDAYLRAGRDQDALRVLTEANKIAAEQGDEDKQDQAERLLRTIRLR
ncbi:MAG: tetratricopeptide repeat protein [Planctomycetota bacterium]